MSYTMDCTSDVQNELNAMSGLTNAAIGANRITNTARQMEPRNVRITRQIFTMDNSSAMQTPPAEKTKQTASSDNNDNAPTSPGPILSSSDKATKAELEAILRRPAHTAEERFLVLEARDKLIRLTTKRTTDIKRAISTQGVCPDMCPEKERLSRESKHRVASFELEEGSKSIMNHIIAVKEYSRSSADQEAALQHDLRPEPVLKLTMTYLLQSIMDLCDVEDTNICDWYHFLWDRTRSIRKDITQQELSSPGTVLLVEQCARFHIHCAARLIAEELSVFDQRINTENLTKCLQSLKYMYHDLGLKMVRCSNEAEFRAYIVLLNLQNTNFLWEVKQLRDDIRQSPEIHFAIKVYLAFESNNYVRFFQLVRSTTYMNACILLRYFTQVRVKALEIMFKAYVPRHPIQMSIEHITYLLVFEDCTQCADFLEYYGLKCDRDSDRALFDRRTFEYPDTPFLLDRALNIVEHKRQTSVGDAVHGCPLDAKDVLREYEPHDSFDENGLLLPRAWTAGDQNYFKPEARTEARTNKTPLVQSQNDENIFKIPTLPPQAPKQRSSPKSAATTPKAPSESAFNAANKLSSSTTNTSQNNLFGGSSKDIVSNDTNLFGSFGGFKSQQSNKLDSNTSKSVFSSSGPANSKLDVTDSLFSIPPSNSSAHASTNLFGSNFSQKPTTSKSLSSNQNLFTSSTNQPGTIFGGSSTSKHDSNSALFAPSAFSKPTASNLFGGKSAASANFSGVVAGATRSEISIGRDHKEDAETREIERLQNELKRRHKELDEIERKEKAEAAEIERKQRLEAERIELERKQRELKRKQIEESSVTISQSIVDEIIEADLRKLLGAEVQRYQQLEESVHALYKSIEHEVIAFELEKIAADVKYAWDKNVLQRFFSDWRLYVRKRREQRQIISNTPQWIPTIPREKLLPEFQHPLQARNLSLMKRYRSGLSMKLIVPPKREDTIDIWSIISPALIKLRAKQHNKPSAIYWKCLISIPDNDEDASYKTINHWLDNVFTRQLSKYPREMDTFFGEQFASNGQTITVCMRKLTGSKMLNESQRMHESKDLHGTNAILFFLSSRNLIGARARLRAVLQSAELSDACGLVIYNSGVNDAIHIKNILRIDEFLNNENIDECFFANGMNHQNNASLCQLTKHGLRYIAQKSFYDDRLEMQQIVSFLRVCLSDELWQRIHLSVDRNPTLRLAATKFTFLRDYYNEAIDRLIALCTTDCTNSPPLFPFELRRFVVNHQLDIPLGLEHFPGDWHLHIERHQNQWETFFNALRIRADIYIADITDIAMLEQRICEFVQIHIATVPDAKKTAYKIIENILNFLQSAECSESADFNARLATYSWLSVMPIFTVDLLSYHYQRFDNKLAGYIIYDRSEYQEYTKTPWWLQINESLLKSITVQVKRNVDNAVEEYETICKRQRLEETLIDEENADLELAIARGYELLDNTDRKLSEIRENRTVALDITKDFDVELYRQEKHTRDTRDFIKSLVEE